MKFLLHGEETERLKFRQLKADDETVWQNLFSEDIARFIALDHLPTPQEKAKAWFERGLKRIQDGLGGLNVLADKHTGEMIGQSGLLVQTVDDVTHLEVGYSILPEFWRMGYAIEAARKCRDCAFLRGYTDELISIIHVDNENSMKVARSNGMQHWKNTMYKDFPVSIFRITKQEWQNLQ